MLCTSLMITLLIFNNEIKKVETVKLNTSTQQEFISSTFATSLAWFQPDGSLIYADMVSKFVHFDGDYNEIFRFNRKGEGPGEINGIHNVTFYKDKYYIVERWRPQITILNKHGEFLEYVKMTAHDIVIFDDKIYATDYQILVDKENANHVMKQVKPEFGQKFGEYPKELTEIEYAHGGIAEDYFLHGDNIYIIAETFNRAYGYDQKTGESRPSLSFKLPGFEKGEMSLDPGSSKNRHMEIRYQKSHLISCEKAGDIVAVQFLTPIEGKEQYTSRIGINRINSKKQTSFLGVIDLPPEDRLLGFKKNNIHVLRLEENDDGFQYVIDIYETARFFSN